MDSPFTVWLTLFHLHYPTSIPKLWCIRQIFIYLKMLILKCLGHKNVAEVEHFAIKAMQLAKAVTNISWLPAGSILFCGEVESLFPASKERICPAKNLMKRE